MSVSCGLPLASQPVNMERVLVPNSWDNNKSYRGNILALANNHESLKIFRSKELCRHGILIYPLSCHFNTYYFRTRTICSRDLRHQASFHSKTNWKCLFNYHRHLHQYLLRFVLLHYSSIG